MRSLLIVSLSAVGALAGCTPAQYARQADVFAVIGTSLVVYPAAGLIHYVPQDCKIYIIDPKMPALADEPNLHKIEKTATNGMEELFKILVTQ